MLPNQQTFSDIYRTLDHQLDPDQITDYASLETKDQNPDASPMLEIYSGKFKSSQTFRLTEVGHGRLMLATLPTAIKLHEILDALLGSVALPESTELENYGTSSQPDFLSKSGENMTPISDNQWIAAPDTIVQWSIESKKVVKEYSRLFTNTPDQIPGWDTAPVIQCLAITGDKKFVFAGTNCGELCQIDTASQQVAHHYGKVHDYYIVIMVVDKTSRYLFTANSPGNQKQFCIKSRSMIKDYKQIDDGMNAIVISPDNRYLFAGSSDLTQISIRRGKLLKLYCGSQEYMDHLRCIVVTSDSKTLLTSSRSDILKISIGNHQLVAEWEGIFETKICQLLVTADNERQFAISEQCYVKMMTLTGEVIRECCIGFGDLWKNQSMTLAFEEQFLFIRSGKGELQCLDGEDCIPINDYERLCEEIIAICY